MREIKFRVWDKESESMLQDVSTWTDDYTDMLNTTINYIKNEGECELMQYTGLKDKNGVEIYESDLLDIEEYGKAKVIFIDGAFMAEWLHEDCYSMELSQITWKNRNKKDLFEVIGNIYENKELLVATNE